MYEDALENDEINDNELYITPGSGSIESTDIPTADEVAEFDSMAHMNSTDMTSSEIEDFVEDLDMGGGVGQVVVAEEQTKLESTDLGTMTLINCSGTISHNQIYFTKLASGLWFINGRFTRVCSILSFLCL